MKENEFDIYEIIEVIDESVTDIIYSGRKHLHLKLKQFWSFLHSNPITLNAVQNLERDNRDFLSKIDHFFLKDNFPLVKNNILQIMEESIVNGGVFGYGFIKHTIIIEGRSQPEIEELFRWSNNIRDYDDAFDSFENIVRNPIIRILKWYLEEKESEDLNDFFSVAELESFEKKIEDLKDQVCNIYDNLNLGQEIIYEELEEIKLLARSQKKKYVFRLLVSSILSYVTSLEQFNLLMGGIKDYFLSIGEKAISLIENL